MDEEVTKTASPRRLSETREIYSVQGRPAYITVDYDPDNPLRPVKVSYATGMSALSDAENWLCDSCELITGFLNQGGRPRDLLDRLVREDGAAGATNYGSLVGRILEELERGPSWAKAFDTETESAG